MRDELKQAIDDGNLEALKSVTKKELEECLTPALLKGHHDLVRFIVEQGVHPDSDRKNTSPLSVYAKNGSLAMVRLLLKSGAYVNNTDGFGSMSALHEAAMHGHMHVVACLLDHKAYINKRNNAGETPLFLAIKNEYSDVSNYLIAHGADVNAECRNNTTPLMQAVENNYINLTAKLIKAGADINHVNDRHETALSIAINQGNIEIINLLNTDELIFHDGLQMVIFKTITPAWDSTLDNETKVKIIDILIKRDPDVLEEFGQLFLRNSVDKSSVELMEFFISHKVIKDDQVPALVTAAGIGNLFMVGRLLQEGANIDYKENGKTALIAGCNKPEIVEYLVEHGADISILDDKGRTAFMASKEINYYLYKEEIKQDKLQFATINRLVDEKDFESLKLAKDISLTDVDGKTLLYKDLKINQFKQIIKLGVDVNKKDLNGQTVMFDVLGKEGNYLQTLIRSGVDLNIQDNMGRTALMMAKGYYSSDLLIHFEANIYLETIENRNALYYVIDYGLHEEALDLIKRGLDINHQNIFGRTAIMESMGKLNGCINFMNSLDIDYSLQDNEN